MPVSDEIAWQGLVRSASLGCSARTWSSNLPREVARQGLDHPLRLARLLDMDLVARSALQGCSVGTWSSAPPRKVARPRLLGICLDTPFNAYVRKNMYV
jgi:hypothetical protein